MKQQNAGRKKNVEINQKKGIWQSQFRIPNVESPTTSFLLAFTTTLINYASITQFNS